MLGEMYSYKGGQTMKLLIAACWIIGGAAAYFLLIVAMGKFIYVGKGGENEN